jgi:hypothetical protein
MAFVVEWPAEHIELSRQEIDAALFLDQLQSRKFSGPRVTGLDKPGGASSEAIPFA